MKRMLLTVLCLVLALSLLASCVSPALPLTAMELLDLGEKYLLELNYERALVQFLRVIEIEPMIPRGYTGAADANIGLGRIDDAIAVLEQGLAVIGPDESIQAMLGEIQGFSAPPAPPEVPASGSAAPISEGDLIWNVEPTLPYHWIMFFRALGYIAYDGSQEYPDGFYIDERTGMFVEESFPTGGFPEPYTYGYDRRTNGFYYWIEYASSLISTEDVILESSSVVLSVYEFEGDDWGWNLIENPKYAIFSNGEFVSDFVYDRVIGGNGVALVMLDGKFAVADYRGNFMTEFVFDDAAEIATGFIAVRIGDKWGFLDLLGEEIIPFIFEDAIGIDEDTAFVKLNGFYGILNVRMTVS